eukprot:TRINITY_DN466_c0_g1_i1.p1 TRINITY_DN466_c0_g1~~TRINITY_DN466_c0_g1_i1.p1  ORF type:complete len:275 (+),score=43.01 TRINITY_DN466_c0_g1_i1:64-825(+)
MPIGKSKLMPNGRRRKRWIDPFPKKEWYRLTAPSSIFLNNMFGKTMVNRTEGTKRSVDALKNRVVQVNLADLDLDEDLAYRKINLRVKEVVEDCCLTDFDGMDFTTEKHKSLIKKWHTLIEAFVDVRTRDGYLLRLFAIAFTKKNRFTKSKTCYAKSSQIKRIRGRMVAIMKQTVSSKNMKDLVKDYLLPNAIGKQIEDECQGIYPLQNAFIRKVKVLKPPSYDPFKILELHGCISPSVGVEEVGCMIERSLN